MKNYLIYPTKKMYISQSYNDNYSHSVNSSGNPYDFPIDESCGSSGRDYFYCPCDEMIVKRIYGVGSGGTNTIWLESTNKVWLANGEESYVTIMVIHPNDDTLKNISVGQKFKRKDKIFLEGTDGNATGNHFHISVSASKYVSGGWVKNNKGTWVIKGNPIKPENAFYVDDSFTEIINRRNLNFKVLPKYLGNSVNEDKEKVQVEVIIDELFVRDAPYGNVLGYVKRGRYDVLEEKKVDDYLWYKIGEDMWIAANEGNWTKYYEIILEDDLEENVVSTDKIDDNTNLDKVDVVEEKTNFLIRFFKWILHIFGIKD